MKYSRTKNFCSHRSSSSGSLPCLLRQVQMYASIANPLVRCWVLVFQLSITVHNIQSSIICLGFFALFPPIFPSITVPIAVSLLLACVQSISFVSFLLFVCNRNLSSPIIASTASFPICSGQLFFCILLYDSTSKVSSHFVSSYFTILDFEPYSTTLHIVVLSSVSSEFCIVYFSVILSSLTH